MSVPRAGALGLGGLGMVAGPEGLGAGAAAGSAG